MQKLIATYRIVTPMFIGDAEQKATSVRPPSIKGALRFWWRALNWRHQLEFSANDVSLALQNLHAEEAYLFGSAAQDNSGGQGCFLLQVTEQPKYKIDKTWPQNNTGSGYLGFGLFESGNVGTGNFQPHREAIVEGSHFTLQLGFKPKTSASTIESLRETLQVWSLLGGLGSRARRGFGSICLETLDGTTVADSLDSYKLKLSDLINNFQNITDYPPYTAFGGHTRFAIIAEGQEAREVHSQAGNAYKDHRGEPSTLRGEVKLPFGLPLQGVDENRRRASPLFFHVHALKNDSFAATVLYLPADFHPDYSSDNLTDFYRPVRHFVQIEAQGN